jgi:hypothetical protein
MKAIPLFCLVALLLLGCEEQPRWHHQLGWDRAHLTEDTRFYRLYARDITREQTNNLKIHGGAPHSGAAEAFLLYGVFEKSFIDCMKAKG